MDVKKYQVKTKLYILILVILIPMVLVQAYFIYKQFKQHIELELDANSDFAEAIGMVFQNHMSSIDNDLFRMGKKIVNSQMSEEEISDYLELENLYNPAVNSYVWLDSNAIIVSSSSKELIGLDCRDREYYKRIQAGEEFVVNEAVKTKASGIPTLIIARAIRNEGQLLGLMSACVNTAFFEEIMPQDRIKPHTSFGIADKNGIIVYRGGSPNILNEMVKANPTGPIIQTLESGTVSKAEKVHSPILNAFTINVANPIPEIGWASYAFSDYEVVLGDAYRNIRYHVIALFLTVFLSIFLAARVSLEILEPIRSLQNFAQKALESNFNVRTNIRGNNELAVAGEALNQMAFRIKQLEINRQLFLESSAHELRNPMTGIKGILYLVRNRIKKGASAEDTLKMLDVIDKEVECLSTKLQQLLDAYKEQNSIGMEFRYDCKAFNLVELLDNVVTAFQARADQHEIVMQTDYEQVIVKGDAKRLEDVARNLLSNAVKYSPEGKEITVSLSVADGNAIIAVKDRGIGIPEDQLDYVFDSFFREF